MKTKSFETHYEKMAWTLLSSADTTKKSNDIKGQPCVTDKANDSA
jgi:hypothetical protein